MGDVGGEEDQKEEGGEGGGGGGEKGRENAKGFNAGLGGAGPGLGGSRNPPPPIYIRILHFSSTFLHGPKGIQIVTFLHPCYGIARTPAESLQLCVLINEYIEKGKSLKLQLLLLDFLYYQKPVDL